MLTGDSLSVYPAQDQATWIGACAITGVGACADVDKTAVSNWNVGVMTMGMLSVQIRLLSRLVRLQSYPCGNW
jgi:hypothetical protein